MEDEIAINDLIRMTLEQDRHECVCVFDGLEAVRELETRRFDLALLDIMLPGLDGFGVFQQLNGVPAIFVTAKSSPFDRIRGLNLGADDYIIKPFEPQELAARVRALLRRTGGRDSGVEIRGVRIDFDSRMVFRNGEAVKCTPQEYGLLEVLVRNRNIALSREKLIELAWGFDYVGDTRTVDVHIQRLRRNLGWEDVICTVYKLGYRLEAAL